MYAYIYYIYDYTPNFEIRDYRFGLEKGVEPL